MEDRGDAWEPQPYRFGPEPEAGVICPRHNEPGWIERPVFIGNIGYLGGPRCHRCIDEFFDWMKSIRPAPREEPPPPDAPPPEWDAPPVAEQFDMGI